MSTTDVLVNIDAATINNKFKSAQTTVDKPQLVGISHVSVMTSDGQTSTLDVTDVSVEEGDEIRWWINTMGLFECVIYNFIDAKTGKAIPDDIISPPALRHLLGQNIADGSDPKNPKFQSTKQYYWGADAEASGSLTIGLQFALYDHNGKSIGYYQYVGENSVS